MNKPMISKKTKSASYRISQNKLLDSLVLPFSKKDRFQNQETLLARNNTRTFKQLKNLKRAT